MHSGQKFIGKVGFATRTEGLVQGGRKHRRRYRSVDGGTRADVNVRIRSTSLCQLLFRFQRAHGPSSDSRH